MYDRLLTSRYSPKVRADITKYASQHGAPAASAFFSRKLGVNVSKSSVNSMKKAYVECVKQKRRDKSDDEIATLPPKK